MRDLLARGCTVCIDQCGRGKSFGIRSCICKDLTQFRGKQRLLKVVRSLSRRAKHFQEDEELREELKMRFGHGILGSQTLTRCLQMLPLAQSGQLQLGSSSTVTV